MRTELKKFDTGSYSVGAPKWKVLIWHFVNYYIFNSAFPGRINLKDGC